MLRSETGAQNGLCKCETSVCPASLCLEQFGIYRRKLSRGAPFLARIERPVITSRPVQAARMLVSQLPPRRDMKRCPGPAESRLALIEIAIGKIETIR